MTKSTRMLIFLLFLLGFPTPLLADGFIIPHPPRPEIKIPPLSVKYHRVQTVIDNQVATTKVSQSFQNDYDRDLEGTYFFPLPEEAAISRFSMWSDGKLLEGKILGKDEARRIYEDIVRQLRDPAILEYVGRNLFKARVFPIPARGEKEISLEYSQMLRCEGGVCQYRYPLNTEKFSARPLQEVTVSVTVSSKVPIKAVYSPTHDVKVVRKGDRTVTASFEKSNIKPDTDFILYYTLTEKEFGANLLTHREAGEPGYFLLFIAPRSTIRKEEVLAKDVVFVLDTSGSMEEEDRLTHAKKALRFCLENLGEDDRFNVISFSSEVETFRKSLVASSEQNRLKAKQFVSDLKPGGGTNIQEALLTAILQLEPNHSRPRYVVFLTDGQPTVGVTRPEDIRENVKKAAKGVRLFTFGVGSDVNALLLDRLAEENRGVPEYMRPGEEMETKLASFSAKISHPALADLELDFGKVEVSQMYPKSITDLLTQGRDSRIPCSFP
ncbi:MAG: VWA domain-containing protein [Armatimonadetes bacterium]|nr:VWA domain-containing protein [Armatimonadota bacterium]